MTTKEGGVFVVRNVNLQAFAPLQVLLHYRSCVSHLQRFKLSMGDVRNKITRLSV
jgi:hypothetical protein